MLTKAGRFGFIGFVFYVSVNWMADNPSKIDDFRNFVNRSVFQIIN